MKLITWNIGRGNGWSWGIDETNKAKFRECEIVLLQEVPLIGNNKSSDYGWLKKEFNTHHIFSSSILSPDGSKADYLLVTMISKKLGSSFFNYECRTNNNDRFALVSTTTSTAIINLHLVTDIYKNRTAEVEESRQDKRKKQIINLCQLNFGKRDVFIGGDFNCDETQAKELIDLMNSLLSKPVHLHGGKYLSYALGSKKPHKKMDYLATSVIPPKSSSIIKVVPSRDWPNKGIHHPVTTTIS